ncbi:hypothetical protein [Streptomyces silvisoli]|uniref:STAS domain-containing protein n=1 Tax=Streptomyces silvisoli TaxID=3034235 RepID=A0ABT5ZQ26_9ACTN|nr:hypothetical protein [Streptomyces silvisoli]MDF3291930.1 hypothetical protein [Streptomyces silvisoli]
MGEFRGAAQPSAAGARRIQFTGVAICHIDLPLWIDLLGQLGRDFADLHITLTALEVQPGSDTLQQLGPKILSIHELIG